MRKNVERRVCDKCGYIREGSDLADVGGTPFYGWIEVFINEMSSSFNPVRKTLDFCCKNCCIEYLVSGK